MHVLVATDGTLDAELTARYALPLAGEDGRITILTVVEINRNLLRDLRSLYGERTVPSIHQDAEYVGLRPDASTGVSPDWPGDDQILEQYLDDKAASRTSALAAALAGSGTEVEVAAREGEDPAAIIVEEAERLGADAVVVGAHGRGAFEALLGSTGTKLARRAPCPVLIMRP